MINLVATRCPLDVCLRVVKMRMISYSRKTFTLQQNCQIDECLPNYLNLPVMILSFISLRILIKSYINVKIIALSLEKSI